MESDELELEAENALKELKKRLGFKAVKLQGRRPCALKAAMRYIIAKEKGWDIITLGKMAEIYGITDVTVRNNVRFLKRLMQNPVMK